MGTHDVERRRLGRDHPSPIEPTQAQGPEPVGITHADDPGLVHEHQRERPVEGRENLGQGVLELAAIRTLVRAGPVHTGDPLADEFGDDVGVARDRARQHPGGVGERCGVGEVSVVPESELALGDAAIDRLGVAPLTGAGRGVADLADGQVPGQATEHPVVEHRGHQAHVLDDGDRIAVADRDAGRFLASVLEGVETQVGHVGDGSARGVDPEDTARLTRFVEVDVGSVLASGVGPGGEGRQARIRRERHGP